MMSDKPIVIVTGANGQLGKELVMLDQADFTIVGLSRDDLDITDLDACRAAMLKYKPYGVIHCAAYTAVDKAESDADEAFRVNGEGTRNVALAAKEADTKLIYVSTDYVFDGKGASPYLEDAPVNPQTVYGRSKLAGEQAVLDIMTQFFIVRTSWVYGRYGSNFVKTMLQLAEQRDQLKVVDDQIGSPTYTYDLALFLVELLKSQHYGIYHASNSGECSWYEFASAIFEESGISMRVDPCTTEEFPRPAPRPAYSVMSHRNLEKNGFKPLRHWRDALVHFLNN